MPTFDDIEVELLKRFPEWKNDFELNFDDYRTDSEKIGQYIIFGDFIIPRINDLVLQQNDKQLRKLFGFFEEVATWDENSDTLIHIEIGEWLVADEHRSYLEQFVGPFVSKAMNTIEEYDRGQRQC
jgi:hypothetical protein